PAANGPTGSALASQNAVFAPCCPQPGSERGHGARPAVAHMLLPAARSGVAVRRRVLGRQGRTWPPWPIHGVLGLGAPGMLVGIMPGSTGARAVFSVPAGAVVREHTDPPCPGRSRPRYWSCVQGG